MIYNIDLRLVGVVVGIALIAAHGIAMVHGDTVRGWLKAFPRSKTMGFVLMAIDAAWAFWLVATMDLGEFTGYRTGLMVLVPATFFLSLKFVDEFLSVRALGMLLLLLAEPLLEAAFLRPETSRLLLVVLAYVWIVAGLFWVGMPYLMRNQVAWLVESETRWRAGGVLGLAYGAAVLLCAIAFYHPAS